jgi:hypothetical protein
MCDALRQWDPQRSQSWVLGKDSKSSSMSLMQLTSGSQATQTSAVAGMEKGSLPTLLLGLKAETAVGGMCPWRLKSPQEAKRHPPPHLLDGWALSP